MEKNCQEVNLRKVAMIGCGFVGSASAFALMQSGLFSEMVLIDADTDRAEGEAMDISHGLPFGRPMKIYAGSYDDIVDAAIIIITAGANQKPEETRLDLVHKNVASFGRHSGDFKSGLSGNFIDRVQPGGYFDLCGFENQRFPGKPGDRFRDSFGYFPFKIRNWRISWGGQPECPCIYYR